MTRFEVMRAVGDGGSILAIAAALGVHPEAMRIRLMRIAESGALHRDDRSTAFGFRTIYRPSWEDHRRYARYARAERMRAWAPRALRRMRETSI